MIDRHQATSALQRVCRFSSAAISVILAAAMAVIVVAGVSQVVSRYVLEISLVWPEETARYMMTGCAFLAIPVLALNRGQIAVDAAMYYVTSTSVRKWLNRLVLAIQVAFLAYLSQLSLITMSEARGSGQVSAGMQVPLWWPLAVIAVGVVVGAVAVALTLVLTFVDPVDTWTPAPEQHPSEGGRVRAAATEPTKASVTVSGVDP